MDLGQAHDFWRVWADQTPLHDTADADAASSSESDSSVHVDNGGSLFFGPFSTSLP